MSLRPQAPANGGPSEPFRGDLRNLRQVNALSSIALIRFQFVSDFSEVSVFFVLRAYCLGNPWNSLEKRFRDQGFELVSETLGKNGIADQDTGFNVSLLGGFCEICGGYKRALVVHDDVCL